MLKDDLLPIGTRVEIIGTWNCGEPTLGNVAVSGEGTVVRYGSYPNSAYYVAPDDPSKIRAYYPVTSVRRAIQSGDAVRVKAGSLIFGSAGAAIMAPYERDFGKKFIITKLYRPGVWGLIGAAAISDECLEPWNDAEEWDATARKWVAKQKPTSVHYPVGTRVTITGQSNIGNVSLSIPIGGLGYVLDFRVKGTNGCYTDEYRVTRDAGGNLGLWYPVSSVRIAGAATTPPYDASQPTYIVSPREGGKLRPGETPKEHAKLDEAVREADRLSRRHPGNHFEVFGRVAMRVTDPTPPAPAKPRRYALVKPTIFHTQWSMQVGDVATDVTPRSSGLIHLSCPTWRIGVEPPTTTRCMTRADLAAHFIELREGA